MLDAIVERPIVVGGQINSYDYGAPFEQARKVSVKAGETVTEDFTVPAPSR